MRLPALGLRQHVLADQQAQFDPHAGKADPLSPPFGAGCNVVIADQILPWHT